MKYLLFTCCVLALGLTSCYTDFSEDETLAANLEGTYWIADDVNDDVTTYRRANDFNDKKQGIAFQAQQRFEQHFGYTDVAYCGFVNCFDPTGYYGNGEWMEVDDSHIQVVFINEETIPYGFELEVINLTKKELTVRRTELPF